MPSFLAPIKTRWRTPSPPSLLYHEAAGFSTSFVTVFVEMVKVFVKRLPESGSLFNVFCVALDRVIRGSVDTKAADIYLLEYLIFALGIPLGVSGRRNNCSELKRSKTYLQ